MKQVVVICKDVYRNISAQRASFLTLSRTFLILTTLEWPTFVFCKKWCVPVTQRVLMTCFSGLDANVEYTDNPLYRR